MGCYPLTRATTLTGGSRGSLIDVLHDHPRGVAESDAVRGDITDYHAIGADDAALTDGHALQDERALPDPGIPANAYRLDLLRPRRQVGDALHRVARMRVGVHQLHVRRDVHILSHHDLFVHGEDYVVSQLDAV